MYRLLRNKIILITGASSGIGAACAQLFAECQARLILLARREDKLQALVQQLRHEYATDIHSLIVDVTDNNAVTEALNKLPEEWQPIDILINNAGLALGLDKFHQADLDDWNTMIDTNVKGLLYMTRAVLPGMVQRNSGHIINIGSIAGHETYVAGNVYCATKHAVHALTQCIKMDLTGYNIRVSSVDPGMVHTEFSAVRFKGDQQRAAKVYQGFTPLSPEDVADAVAYCASRPPHVNIREVMIMPTAQSSATLTHKET